MYVIYVDYTYLLPSLINAIAIIIRFRRNINTNKHIASKTAETMSSANHTFFCCVKFSTGINPELPLFDCAGFSSKYLYLTADW